MEKNINIKWTKDEEILLVEMFDKVYIKKYNLTKECDLLSIKLKEHAKSLGLDIDEKYRNISGLKMKYQNLIYLYTSGKEGLSSYSNLDKEIMDLYKNDNVEFVKTCNNINLIFGGIDLTDNININVLGEDEYNSNKLYDYLSYNEYLLRQDFYKINLFKFKGVGIEKLGLSIRSYNVLQRNNISFVDELVMFPLVQLFKFKNLGQKSIKEIIASISIDSLSILFQNSIINTQNEVVLNNICIKNNSITTLKMPKIVFEKLKNLQVATIYDFMKIDDKELKLSLTTLRKFEELKNKCLAEYPEFYSDYFDELLKNIDFENYELSIKYFFNTKTVTQLQNNNINTIEELIYSAEKTINYLLLNKVENVKILKILSNPLEKFVCEQYNYAITRNWQSPTLEKDWERNVELITFRAIGLTLQDVGNSCDLTRERIRQIEKRKQILFNRICCNKYLFAILEKYSSKDNIIFITDINAFLENRIELFVFLLKNSDWSEVSYNEILEAFVLGEDWTLRLEEYIELIPQVINVKELETYFLECRGYLNKDIEKDVFIKYIDNFYIKNGEIYSKSKLTLLQKYKEVLYKYFSNGISVYDDDELNKFRVYYDKTFDDNKCPLNNRALQGRIIDNCILADRGYYKLKQTSYISNELENKIFTYIYDSNQEVFMFNNLLRIFESELLELGVDNRYYLQGILHDAYNKNYQSRPLFFTKDYVSKSAENTNLKNEIISRFKEANGVVLLDDILIKYEGIAENVIIQNIFTTDIIPLFNRKYIHIDNLRLNEEEIIGMKNIIAKMVQNDKIINDDNLYINVSIEYPDLLERNNVENAYYLFGIARSLYNDEFQFKRPFIANNEVEIGCREDRIKALIYPYEKINLEDVLDEIDEQGIRVMSFNDFLVTINNDYFRVDFNTLVRSSKINVNDYQIEDIERYLLKLMGDKGYISYLNVNDFSFLPNIGTNYNHWILSSIIRKYSSKIRIVLISNNYKMANPIYVRNDINVDNLDDLINTIVVKTSLDKNQIIEKEKFYYKK